MTMLRTKLLGLTLSCSWLLSACAIPKGCDALD